MKLTPVPRGMSPGFYLFMGAGCRRSPSGEMLMLADTPDATGKADNDFLADIATVELLHALETPINGLPSIKGFNNYSAARQLVKAAMLAVFQADLRQERDEYKHRAEMWERLHDHRTTCLRSVEEKLDAIQNIKGDYDGYKTSSAIGVVIEELTTEIANAADACSYADLAAAGGIVGAP